MDLPLVPPLPFIAISIICCLTLRKLPLSRIVENKSPTITDIFLALVALFTLRRFPKFNDIDTVTVYTANRLKTHLHVPINAAHYHLM